MNDHRRGTIPRVTLVEARPRRTPQDALAPWRSRLDRRSGPALIMLIAAIAAVHAAVVASHYHVGSFDDDGHYLALARAFAHGHGYVDTSLPGAPTETLYPPGYPALLVPLLWLFGDATWPLRALSALAMVACVPLMDVLLRRHRVATLPRLFALLLFALSPVAATFATMVMPEAIFLVVLLGVLVALPRWQRQARVLTPIGAVVAFGTPMLLLLKAAALPMVAAVVIWLAFRRCWRLVGAVVASSIVLLAPVVIARLAAGSVVGDRYAGEFTRHGDLVTRVSFGVHHYITDAIPESILQWFSADLSHHGPLVDGPLAFFRYTAAALVVIGWVTWLRLRPDVTLLIVPLYLVETVTFPYINERRIVLVLPLVLAWYVLGWSTVGAALRRWRPWRSTAAVVAYAVGPALLLVPVAMQFPRNYLLAADEVTSKPTGSGYAAAIRSTTPPGWSLATGYRWTMALVTGRTARNETFLDLPCPPTTDAAFASRARAMLRDEHAATALVGALNRPTWIDSRCLLTTLATVPWALGVYDGADKSAVFLLLGPGTARPDAEVALTVARPAATTQLGGTVAVTEVSVEARGLPSASVALQLRGADGSWVTVATGQARTDGALLHARFATPVRSDEVRVIAARGVELSHLVVLRGR
jgi:hypothetical protein